MKRIIAYFEMITNYHVIYYTDIIIVVNVTLYLFSLYITNAFIMNNR